MLRKVAIAKTIRFDAYTCGYCVLPKWHQIGVRVVNRQVRLGKDRNSYCNLTGRENLNNQTRSAQALMQSPELI